MKFQYLFIGTSMLFLPQLTFAQCVATQDCSALGYTETSCSGGKGVKCPFGNKWACIPTKDSICKEEGFTLACNGAGQIGSGDACGNLYKKCTCDSSYKYACSGTGYAGGSGTACGRKYKKCNCKSGYTWNGSACEVTCTNKYTSIDCANECQSVNGTPCYKNGVAYYPSCTSYKCASGEICGNGQCIGPRVRGSCCSVTDCPYSSFYCPDERRLCQEEGKSLGYTHFDFRTSSLPTVEDAGTYYDYRCYFW